MLKLLLLILLLFIFVTLLLVLILLLITLPLLFYYYVISANCEFCKKDSLFCLNINELLVFKLLFVFYLASLSA
jgi:hypothetical protein